jgi:hypothetical protein
MTYEESEYLELLKSKIPGNSIFLDAKFIDTVSSNVGMIFFDNGSPVDTNLYNTAWNLLVPGGILCVRKFPWAMPVIKKLKSYSEIVLPPCPTFCYIVKPNVV